MRRILFFLIPVFIFSMVSNSCSNEKHADVTPPPEKVKGAYQDLQHQLSNFNSNFFGDRPFTRTKERRGWFSKLLGVAKADVSGAVAGNSLGGFWGALVGGVIFSAEAAFNEKKTHVVSFNQLIKELLELMPPERKLLSEIGLSLMDQYPREQLDLVESGDVNALTGFLHNIILSYAHAVDSGQMDNPRFLFEISEYVILELRLDFLYDVENDDYLQILTDMHSHLGDYINSDDDFFDLLLADYPVLSPSIFSTCNTYMDNLEYIDDKVELFQYTNGFGNIVQLSGIPAEDKEAIMKGINVGANSSILWEIEGNGLID